MAQHYLESLLSEREQVLLVARQHWFVLARNIFFELFVILVILAATVTAAVFFPPYALIIVAVGFAGLLIPIGSLTHDILHWTNCQYIVTNRRVMQIAGIINKNVTDSSLEKVNDVKMSQSAFGRMFDYGDVEILTASELGANLFQQIENPIHFKTAMLNAKERLERGDVAAQPHSDIPSLITRLDLLRQQGVLTEEEFQSKKAELLAKL